MKPYPSHTSTTILQAGMRADLGQASQQQGGHTEQCGLCNASEDSHLHDPSPGEHACMHDILLGRMSRLFWQLAPAPADLLSALVVVHAGTWGQRLTHSSLMPPGQSHTL